MDFILYRRVSTQKQDLGLDAQQAQAERYVASVGGCIIGVYTEKESGKKDSRPQLANAIAECKSRHATLLIAKLDRLSRNVSFLFKLKEDLGSSGVDVVAADMPEVLHNTLMLSVIAGLAQQERELISSRTKAALKALKERGVKLGAEKGRDTAEARRRSMSVRSAEADAWAQKQLPVISALREGGLSYRRIAATLNAEGRETRRGDYQWTACTVFRVCRRSAIK